MPGFELVQDIGALDELFDRSNNEPIVIFKHSNTCPISSGAYNEIEEVTMPVSLVVVQKARDLSSEIAARTGLMHESPQILVLRNGAVVYSASHWNITAKGVEDAFAVNS
jgi:bacillithiol system protein YtxJ